MADQSPNYTNLELLQDALIQERRTLVQEWARSARPVDAPALGEKIRDIQASLDTLKVVMNDEDTTKGTVTYI